MLAIAAADLGREELAMDRYLSSLRGLQEALAEVTDAGNEDGFLATTIFLCVFENLRSDGPPSIGLHAKAAGVLLSRRHPGEASQSLSQPDKVFERTCAESFLYHSTLTMLLDPSLDLVISNIPRCLVNMPAHTSREEQDVPHFVLEESYHFFIMIAEVTRLARLSRPICPAERQTWIRLQAELLQYQVIGCMDDLMKSLYVYTLRILLLKADSTRTVIRRTTEMRALLQKGLSTLETLDVQKYLIGYSLWPMAVLGAIALGEDEQRIIDGIIDPWARGGRGQALRLRGRLKTIWATPEDNQETLLLRRLHLLMEMN
ncbi:hypothetical protein PEBR_29788 [Penicillium brasilianum]|uniref:Uncharacterized protein n=1 Tax=Penicillium brasilianum TaxID=104259 RepID=A0A1S9RG34_PENBI|nr:hypothetical protein PEBR_29788 [Penicillium brasilianum]